MQQLIQLVRFNAQQRLLLGDDPLVHQVGGHLQRGGRGAFAVAGLQQEQLAVLDGELHVLHVTVVGLHAVHRVDELVVGLGQHLTHLRERPRGADASHHVLALGVDEELAVEFLGARRRVAGEAHAGGGVVTAVAEDHLHDVDGGAEVGGNVVGAAVNLGARILPGTEHRVHGPVKLFDRVGGPLATQVLVADLLEGGHQLLQVRRSQVGVELDAALALQLGQRVLVGVGRDALDHLAVHLNETAVAVPRETFVAGFLGDGRHGLVGDTEVEDGVHHAGHGKHCAGTHRNQQRILGTTEFASRAFLQPGQARVDLVRQTVGPFAAPVHGFHAGRRGDGEGVGDRDPDPGHLSDARPLSPEQVTHGRVTFREVVDVAFLAHSRLSPLIVATGLPRPPQP